MTPYNEAWAYTRLGYYCQKLYKYEYSFNLTNKAYLLYSELNDSLKSGRRLLTMAYIQKHVGDYVNSKTIATDALRYLIPKDDHKYIASAYHLTSIDNKELNDYENAIYWNERSLELSKNPEYSNKIKALDIIKYSNTRGNILRDTKQYVEAIKQYTELLSNDLVNKNLLELSRIKDNLGYTKWLIEPQDRSAINLMKEAFDIRNQKKAFSGLISSNLHLSKYYSKENISQAIEYVSSALENGMQIKNPIAILESLDQLVALKKEIGIDLTSEAIRQSEIRNELTAITQKNRRIYAETKFRNEKLKEENVGKTLEALRQRNFKNIFIAVGVLLTIGLIPLYFFLKQRAKFGRSEERFNTEKRLSKKIHDELGNDIFYLMTQIQNNPVLLEENGFKILDGLQNIYSKARDISREYSSIETGDGYIEELLSLLNSFGGAHVKIVTSTQDLNFWGKINKNIKMEVFRLVLELLTNMKKHSMASLVAINFNEKNENTNYLNTALSRPF